MTRTELLAALDHAFNAGVQAERHARADPRTRRQTLMLDEVATECLVDHGHGFWTRLAPG